MVDNRSIFTVLRRGLRRRGFGRVLAVNYSPLTGDVRLAHQLADHVEALCEETGYERIHLDRPLMGGLVARYYVQRLGGDERVHTLVTLGTPHQRHAHGACSRTRWSASCGPTATLVRRARRSRPPAAGPGSWRSGATSTR